MPLAGSQGVLWATSRVKNFSERSAAMYHDFPSILTQIVSRLLLSITPETTSQFVLSLTACLTDSRIFAIWHRHPPFLLHRPAFARYLKQPRGDGTVAKYSAGLKWTEPNFSLLIVARSIHRNVGQRGQLFDAASNVDTLCRDNCWLIDTGDARCLPAICWSATFTRQLTMVILALSVRFVKSFARKTPPRRLLPVLANR